MKFNAAFWKWFGDSKVVDGHDEPLIVYHGSISPEFSVFDIRAPQARARTGPDGFYFTSDRAAAEQYSYDKKNRKRGHIVAAYLRLENPLDITQDVRKFQKSGLSFGDAKRKALKKLNDGHDGVWFGGNSYNPDEFIVFDPRQIKIGANDGTWDVDDADIRSNPDEERMFKIASDVRNRYLSNNKLTCTADQCMDMSDALYDELDREGMRPTIVNGRFIVSRPTRNLAKAEHYAHTWVEVDGEIIDISADQFGKKFPPVWIDAPENRFIEESRWFKE